MDRKSVLVAALVLVPLAAWPAAAAGQEDVVRRSYPFLGDRLIVQVATEAPGVLRVMRGNRGQVEVAGRARDGFVGFGLGTEPVRQLRLSAVGDGTVEYLIVVPEDVRLSLQLPERQAAELPPRAATALYRWGAAATEPAGGAAVLLPAASGLLLAHSAAVPPGVLDVPELAGVRSIGVRIEGNDFRVAASRAVAIAADGGALSVRTDGQPIDLLVWIPPTTGSFVLRAGGATALEINSGRARTVCNGVAVQEPTPYQHWFTFYPTAGRLSCR